MKKYLTLIGLLMVFAFSLTMFSGCAEKQAVVKDEAVQEQKAASAQQPATVQQMTKQPAERKNRRIEKPP